MLKKSTIIILIVLGTQMLILYAANTYHYITLCVHLCKNIKEKILCHILLMQC